MELGYSWVAAVAIELIGHIGLYTLVILWKVATVAAGDIITFLVFNTKTFTTKNVNVFGTGYIRIKQSS